MSKAEAAGMAVGGATALGVAALTASMLKSSTPKEAEYILNRLRDGRFTTTFKDAKMLMQYFLHTINS